MQVEAGESKLLLFETFWFFSIFFFTRAISRGARAPKNKIRLLTHVLVFFTITYLNSKKELSCCVRNAPIHHNLYTKLTLHTESDVQALVMESRDTVREL